MSKLPTNTVVYINDFLDPPSFVNFCSCGKRYRVFSQRDELLKNRFVNKVYWAYLQTVEQTKQAIAAGIEQEDDKELKESMHYLLTSKPPRYTQIADLVCCLAKTPPVHYLNETYELHHTSSNLLRQVTPSQNLLSFIVRNMGQLTSFVKVIHSDQSKDGAAPLFAKSIVNRHYRKERITGVISTILPFLDGESLKATRLISKAMLQASKSSMQTLLSEELLKNITFIVSITLIETLSFKPIKENCLRLRNFLLTLPEAQNIVVIEGLPVPMLTKLYAMTIKYQGVENEDYLFESTILRTKMEKILMEGYKKAASPSLLSRCVIQ